MSEPINLIQLNSSEDDFAPSWNKYSKNLYFNSEKTGKCAFYISQLNDSNQLSKAVYANNGINNGDNNAFITFINENEALISSYQQYSRRSYQNIFQIFERRKEWTKPVFVESLGFEGFVSQPTISPSGKILVFVSNRESQNKELNLWIAFRQENGTYTNLSAIKELNTNGDEITPFFASEDTLFFASNGQEGPGGFDIFYSVFKEGIWSQPIPMIDINTKFDESDFVTLPNNVCLFASNRPGGKGKLDLYESKISRKKIESKKYESEIELSIATQVSSIKLNYNILYKSFILNPVILNDRNLDNIYSEMLKIKDIDTMDIKADLKDVTKQTLNIIAERLKGNFTALLTIKINQKDDIAKAENLKNSLCSIFNISASRIIIQKEELSPEINMMLESSDKSIFSPINIGSTEFVFEPKVLEILLNARPINLIKSWELKMNGADIFDIDKGTSLPYQINLDLQRYKNKFLNIDSLNLVFTAEENSGAISYQTSVINLNQSESRRKDLIKSGKKFYENIQIFSPQNLTAESEFFGNITKFLSENTKPNNPILIYSSDNNKNAIFLKEWLLINFHSKNIQVIEKKDNLVEIDNANIISIYIEKGDF